MVFIVKRFCVTKEVDIEGVGKGGAPVCVVMVPSFGMRTAVAGRGGRLVVVMMQVVEEEEEGDDECSLGHTKFEQPGRHGSSRDSVRGTSSDSLLWALLSAGTSVHRCSVLPCASHLSEMDRNIQSTDVSTLSLKVVSLFLT